LSNIVNLLLDIMLEYPVSTPLNFHTTRQIPKHFVHPRRQ